MIHAYDQQYLDKAQVSLAQMMRYAVQDLKYDPDVFFEMFVCSGLADRFGAGEAHYTVGMSGVEMACEVIFLITGREETVEPVFSLEKSDVYWAGWALAFYQWYTARTFADIIRFIKISHIIKMYDPFHEADIMKFVEEINHHVPALEMLTRLTIYRKKAGMTQRQLAEFSGVSIRMIQKYEQRAKDINKAEAETIWKLSDALGCEMKELLEVPTQIKRDEMKTEK